MLEYFVPGSHIFIVIDVFFIYSFLGWVMECIVITYEQKHLTLNRGFVHGPFCIIYGFGALIGYALVKPFAHNPVILFIVGAVFASLLELLTAKLMVYFFGSFWWDYSAKPFNYKGILCLESTLAWGVLAIVIVNFFHGFLIRTVASIIPEVTTTAAIALILWYAIDFGVSVRQILRENKGGTESNPILVLLNKVKG